MKHRMNRKYHNSLTTWVLKVLNIQTWTQFIVAEHRATLVRTGTPCVATTSRQQEQAGVVHVG